MKVAHAFLPLLSLVFACSRGNVEEDRAKRNAYLRDVLEKEDAGGAFELTQNPDVRFGGEWSSAELIADPGQPIRVHRWMGRLGTIMLRADDDTPRTLTLTAIPTRPSRMHGKTRVTLRAGNDFLDSFDASPSDRLSVVYAFTFAAELLRKYRAGGFVHITLDVPTSEDPGARGYKAYGLALTSVKWTAEDRNGPPGLHP